VVMMGGQVVEQGPAAQVLDDPANGAVRRFLAGELIF